MREAGGRYNVIRCRRKDCLVRKSRASSVKMHRFPKDIETCREWVRFAENPVINERPIESLWKSHFLCHQHFTPDQFVTPKSGKLIPNAIPTVLSHVRLPLEQSQPKMPLPPLQQHQRQIPSAPHVIDVPSIGTCEALPTQLSGRIEIPSPENDSLSFWPPSPASVNSTPMPSSPAAPASSSIAECQEATTCSLPRGRVESSLSIVASHRRTNFIMRKSFSFFKYRRLCRRNAYFKIQKLAKSLLSKFKSRISPILESYSETTQREPLERRISSKPCLNRGILQQLNGLHQAFDKFCDDFEKSG